MCLSPFLDSLDTTSQSGGIATESIPQCCTPTPLQYSLQTMYHEAYFLTSPSSNEEKFCHVGVKNSLSLWLPTSSHANFPWIHRPSHLNEGELLPCSSYSKFCHYHCCVCLVTCPLTTILGMHVSRPSLFTIKISHMDCQVG